MAWTKDQKFDVAKDPLDLRDLLYEGSLREIPKWVDNRGKVPFVLNQGKEGACTGFGLAAVVNFLIHNRSDTPPLMKEGEGASARMLYEMAKRYDEWEGENYEGSSIRGAMKGWQKHGVCREKTWPYRAKDKNPRLSAKRLEEALDRPLGNYFRVRHRHLSHMHSALTEVGVLYASARVHEGWYKVDASDAVIPFEGKPLGGHAFAVVGYDDRGLWIQNSWDRDWGLNGFGLLTYDDWLENGYDCWVARMGVATKSVAATEGAKLGKALTFDYLPHEEVVFKEIKPHFVNLGNDGKLSSSGRYQNDNRDVSTIFDQYLPELTASWSRTPRLLLYAHGGLNGEKASAARIASLRPYFVGNEIYPVHFMWETGIWDAIKGIVQDADRDRRFSGLWDQARERYLDLMDDAIELATRGLGRPIWAQMKDNAQRASQVGGGAEYVVGKIANYMANVGRLELHLVGHSAGSIFLGHLVPEIKRRGLKVKSLTLYAPACSTELFKSSIQPYVGRGRRRCIDRLTVFNLTDEAERDDTVVNVYHKSLLYLVSEAFEVRKHQPLVGMERFLSHDRAMEAALGTRKRRGLTVIHSRGGANIALASSSTSHGGFDNDPDTLNSTLRIIRASNTLQMEVPRSATE